jgi:hypothetical protein
VPDEELSTGPGGAIFAPGKHLCPIVHLYNYKPALLKHVQAAYPEGRA